MNGAMEKIRAVALGWSGVTTGPHRFGGVEFRVGNRELGHIHGDRLLDLPFPIPVRNKLVESGRANAHHILPHSGWVSFPIRSLRDVEAAVELLRLSYELAAAAHRKKSGAGSAAVRHGAGEVESPKEKQ